MDMKDCKEADHSHRHANVPTASEHTNRSHHGIWPILELFPKLNLWRLMSKPKKARRQTTSINNNTKQKNQAKTVLRTDP